MSIKSKLELTLLQRGNSINSITNILFNPTFNFLFFAAMIGANIGLLARIIYLKFQSHISQFIFANQFLVLSCSLIVLALIQKDNSVNSIITILSNTTLNYLFFATIIGANIGFLARTIYLKFQSRISPFIFGCLSAILSCSLLVYVSHINLGIYLPLAYSLATLLKIFAALGLAFVIAHLAQPIKTYNTRQRRLIIASGILTAAQAYVLFINSSFLPQITTVCTLFSLGLIASSIIIAFQKLYSDNSKSLEHKNHISLFYFFTMTYVILHVLTYSALLFPNSMTIDNPAIAMLYPHIYFLMNVQYMISMGYLLFVVFKINKPKS